MDNKIYIIPIIIILVVSATAWLSTTSCQRMDFINSYENNSVVYINPIEKCAYWNNVDMTITEDGKDYNSIGGLISNYNNKTMILNSINVIKG